MPQEQNPASQGQPEKLIKAAMQEYLYRNAIDPTAYWPEKYWLTRPEGTTRSHPVSHRACPQGPQSRELRMPVRLCPSLLLHPVFPWTKGHSLSICTRGLA